MVGSRAEKHHSSRVGKNWVMMGFCNEAESVLQGAAALAPATGSAAFADTRSPAPWLPLHPGQAQQLLMVRLTGPGKC